MYIRDLYDLSSSYPDFLKEAGNPKSWGKTAWSIADLMNLKAQCGTKFANEFVLLPELSPDAPRPSIRNKSELAESVADLLLRISRPAMEAEPLPDPRLEPWLDVKRPYKQPPVVNYLDKVAVNPPPEPEEDQADGADGVVVAPEPAVEPEWDYYSNHPELAEPFAAYKQAMESYYQRNIVAVQLADLYDNLHTLYYDIKGNANKGVVLSFGLADVKMGEVRYRNYLFQVPLIISLKSHKIELSLERATSSVSCDAFFVPFFAGLYPDRTDDSIMAMKEEVLAATDAFNNSMHLMDFDPEYMREEFYDPALKILQEFRAKVCKFFIGEEVPQGKMPNPTLPARLDFGFHEESDDKNLIFSFSPVFQTRIMEFDTMVSRDATRIVGKINELELSGQTELIPALFKKMFVVKAPEIVPPPPPAREEIVGELVFPKPYNKEQLNIIKRISAEDALLVEGPPGTGKSHTIANIISQAVGKGQRVLVASQNAKALSVIRDKIPDGIRDLSVAVLNEGRSNEMLKNSVNSIIAHLGQEYDPALLEKMIQEQLRLYQTYLDTQARIRAKIASNHNEYEIQNPVTGEKELRPAFAWAEMFMRHEPVQTFIPDRLSYEQDVSGLAEKLLELYNRASQVRNEDFDLTQYHYPAVELLLSPESFEGVLKRLDELRAGLDGTDFGNPDCQYTTPEFFLGLGKASSYLQEFSSGPAQAILSSNKFNRQWLQDLIDNHWSDHDAIVQSEKKLVNYIFNLEPIQDDLYGDRGEALLGTIDSMLSRLRNGNQGFLNAIFKNNFEKRIGKCMRDDSRIDDLDELETLREYVILARRKKAVLDRSNHLVKTGFLLTHTFYGYDECLVLRRIAEWCELRESLNAILHQMRLPEIKLWGAEALAYAEMLQKIAYQKEMHDLENLLGTHVAYLNGDPVYHPVLREMAGFIGARDPQAYRDGMDSYRRLLPRVAALNSFNTLYADLFPVLPGAVQLCLSKAREGGILDVSLDKINEAIFYSKIDSALCDALGAVSGLDRDMAMLHQTRANLFSKTADLTAFSAWSKLKASVTEEQLACLNAWLNALINVGRGKGVDTAKNLKAAAHYMREAKNAVPVWIMTLRAAITFFADPQPGHFDLLIIDEATQCEISSFNLVFRAKKSIIVGDIKQTAVMMDRNLFSKARVQPLVRQYFPCNKFQINFDVTQPTNNIYSIGWVFYPDIVSLREHFRCLPEIIEFSNQLYYDGRIIPLKTSDVPQLGDPVQIIFVEDDPASKIKPLIVKRVVEEVEDIIARYEAKELPFLPTVGILTLENTYSTHRNAMIRALAQSESVKAHEEKLDLLVGTSREFQGDERHVMLITSPISQKTITKNNKATITKMPDAVGEVYDRNYNVAASRAIYRSVIFHCIQPELLALANENCNRKLIIDYYTKIKTINKPRQTTRDALLFGVDPILGEFGNQLCEWLIEQGYSQWLYPQFKIGNTILDFAICKEDVKIAIICDGCEKRSEAEFINSSMEQQQVLERVAWKYYRLQSTEWFYHSMDIRAKLAAWLAQQMNPLLPTEVR